MNADDENICARACALADKIAPLLAGNGPQVQSAALALLTVQWVNGWPKFARDDVLDAYCSGLRAMVADLRTTPPPPH
jgi:hypothetical protein